MQILSKEDLLNYMRSGAIHVSKKDYGFYNNLYYLIKDRRKITSNQDKLFNKLILKYQRQLKKNNLDLSVLQQTRWTTEVVDTQPEFLEAYITLKSNFLTIRTPFNSKFIKEIRNSKNVNFEWSKDERVYKTVFSTIALKTALDAVKKHFSIVKLSEEISFLLDQLVEFNTMKYWTPTYVKSGDRYYIYATNQFVESAISNITFDDSLKTLNLLSLAGISLDASVLGQDRSKHFASSFFTEVDIQEFDDVCEWLKLLEVDTVIASRDLIHNKSLVQEVKSTLNKYELSLVTDKNCNGNNKVLLKTFKYNHIDIHEFSKVIHLLNSRPISLKGNK